MIVVFDIGGTRTRVAGGEVPEDIGEPVIFPTPQNYEEALEELVKAAKDVAHGEEIKALSLGVPAVLGGNRTILLRATHLPHWEGKNLAHDLGTALGAPVYLQNDAALGALGEATYGAGKGADIVAYIAVGTGIGGARIVDGVIDRTAVGFEIGHQYLSVDGEMKKFEDLVSGAALEKRYGKHPAEITDPIVWEECSKIFCYGLTNTILHWSPDVVVLGGSLFNEVGMKIETVRADLKKIPHIFPVLPEIKHAALGDRGGLLGALVYAKQQP